MDMEQFKQLFSQHTNFKENRFHPLVWINGEPEIGMNVYIGGMSEVNGKGARVVIGDNCDIASFVSINCADSHKLCIGESETIQRKDIIIGNNVFIGSHSVIKGGASIGHHSVIAAGTIVDGVEIPPYSLVYGNPMQVRKGYYQKKETPEIIPHNKPTIEVEEETSVIKVMRTGWIAHGTEVKKFENEFCEYLGFPHGHAVAVSSGTAALFLALQNLGVKNKMVLSPVYACSAIRNAISLASGIEKFADSSSRSPNIDQEELNRYDSFVSIIPHTYGIPVDVTMNIEENANFIEDCAQSLGAKINGKSVGVFGRASIFSFYASKIITTGGHGGMVVSTDKSFIDQVRDYLDFDQRLEWRPRFNFYMTDIQATVGREQLKKLPSFILRREEIFQMYRESGLDLLSLDENRCIQPVRYRAILNVQHPHIVSDQLLQEGIKVINPMESWELQGDPNDYPRAKAWTQRTISLPIYPTLKDKDIKFIIEKVKKVVFS